MQDQCGFNITDWQGHNSAQSRQCEHPVPPRTLSDLGIWAPPFNPGRRQCPVGFPPLFFYSFAPQALLLTHHSLQGRGEAQ